MISIERLLAVRPRLKPFYVDEWGETVYVRPLTEAERNKFLDLASRFEKASPGEKNRKVVWPCLLWAICNEDGSPLFASLEQLEQVAENNDARIFLAFQNEVFNFSALTPGSREEAEKNLPAVPSDSSSSS
jgi:hypothetical protein